ncbi:MAG TPA: M13 family metallopeptidase [Terracidiphilus sp.]|jgi:endothelin-converting enzyme/putative endopeptidase|nr:M13 family metallopeptidase [Terracidiphilus sp.]
MKLECAIGLWFVSAVGAFAQTASPIELQHIDVTFVDSSMNPCDNFYQYTCSKTNAANPIPPDQMDWGPAGELAEWNRQILRQILEKNEAPNSSRTANEQKVGDLYASCMDQARSNANDLSAVQPLLDRIDAMKGKHEISTVLAMMHSSYDPAWQGDENQTHASLFGFGQQADYNDVTRVVAAVDQGGIGMPNRDFYLTNDDKSKSVREAYRQFLITALQLGGENPQQAASDAATVLRVETALATAQMDNVTRRDPNKINNRFTAEQLEALMPAFDWAAYFKGISAPAPPLYEVSTPDFFRVENKLLVDEDLATWKIYLRTHLLAAAAPVLGKAWRDAEFAFEKVLTGQKEEPPDWRRCTSAVDGGIGQALGQVYVAQVFPPESKARALKMVSDIEAAMGRDIDSVSWMQPATKKEAHQKLSAVINKVGYPDNWIDYSSLTITRDSYPANAARAAAFELKRQLSFIGKPLDRTQWLMTPPTVNAYEDPQTNTINFPAGILQPIYFDSKRDDVVNYGAEGAVVGHELTHDFDDQGRKFDVNGNLRDWWQPSDEKAYEVKGACIAKEYTVPVPGVPGAQQNGKLTQGEDTADNGGIHLALSALVADLMQQGKSLDDKDEHGLTNLQRFFIAYGNSWCDTYRPELAQTLVKIDPHSMPELRVNNVVSNMPEFQKAFDCKAGQPMVHETRCRVW